jgi:hypothetical protein
LSASGRGAILFASLDQGALVIARIMLNSIILALAVAWSAGAWADCPVNTLRICAQTATYTVPAHGDSVPYCTLSSDFRDRSDAAGYDIPGGLVWAHEKVIDGFGANVTAEAHDTYWIVGPAAGSAISCSVQCAMNGYGNCGARGTLSLVAQGQTTSGSFANDLTVGPCNSTPALNSVASLTVSAQVDEPFDVSEKANLFGPFASGGSAYLSGRLSFTGLPPGYAVVSCNGFGGGPSTPARAMTWGRLRDVYR